MNNCEHEWLDDINGRDCWATKFNELLEKNENVCKGAMVEIFFQSSFPQCLCKIICKSGYKNYINDN